MDFFLNETDYYSHRNYRNDLLDPNTQLGNYWIGFFLADGHLTDKGGLEFFQCIKNQPIVDKFNSYSKGSIKSTSQSMDREGNRIYLQKSPVVDKYVKDFDVSTNMKDNPIFGKILNHIDTIKTDSRLLNAFIAGFIDGDGHITKKGKCRIELKSTWEPFLKKIKEVLGLNSNVNKRKNRDASYLDIRKSKMKELKRGQESFLGPRWERVLESFDFDSDNDYELGQPIIDRYKAIQTLEDLISKFVYTHYPNNKNVVTPRVVLDSFIWRFFPFYYDNDDDYIEGISYDFGDKCKMTIIHTGINFERYERKRIKLEFPKKSTRKSFVEECSRKMAEGLVDAGIDMKHLVTEKTELSEAFDFNNDSEELGRDIIDRYKNIQFLSELFYEYAERAFSSGCTARPWPISAMAKFLDDHFQYYYAPNEANETIRYSGHNWNENSNVFIELMKDDKPVSKVKIEIPLRKKKEIDKELFIKEASRKMAEGLVDAGIDMKHINNIEALSETFDFDESNYDFSDIVNNKKTLVIFKRALVDSTFLSEISSDGMIKNPATIVNEFVSHCMPYYHHNPKEFILSMEGDDMDKIVLSVVHSGTEIYKRNSKVIDIEVPAKISVKEYKDSIAEKIAKVFVDVGADVRHLECRDNDLHEAFDFNDDDNDEADHLDSTVNKLKRIALLSNRINDEVEYMKERLEEVDDSMMEGVSFLDNIIFHLFSHMEDPYEAVDFTTEGAGNGYNYILYIPKKTHIGKPIESNQKVYLPMMIDVSKNVSSYVRSIAKALVEIDADKMCNLFESFDFGEDLEIDGNIEAIKKEHEYRRLCIDTFFEFLRERTKEGLKSLLNPSPYSKKIYQEYGINTMNQFHAMFAGPLYSKIMVRTRSLDQKEKRLNYSLSYITSNFSFDYKEVELCSFDWDRMMKFGDKEHIKDFFEMFWDEIGTSENALLLGGQLVETNFMIGESFDFDNDAEYDLGIDKISTYYKLLEKELDFLLDTHAGPKGRYNVALMLSLFLQRIGLVASEITVSNVKYPKGTIHFRYDETDRNHWKSLISGNREETKNEIRRMLSGILNDEEVFYDLTEIMKENKLNESFDFDDEDNYEQEIDDKVSKIRKFQEWNFVNGFNILENFYSMGLKKDPNMKVYAYPSVSLLINILYSKDDTLPQGDTREVRVTISENQSRNNGTGLYFRNNKTGKISYKVFPYEYTVKDFKDKWAYLVIEALEEIGASKSTLMRKNDSLYEAFDFSNDDEDSLLEKISEIALIRKIVEMFEERAKESFNNYFGSDSKEMYTTTAYNVYLDKIKDYINEKSGQWFGIGTSWVKNNYYTMDIKVMNADGGEFMMQVPYKVSFEELTDEEFPRFLKAIMDNMPEYKEILLNNF